MKLTFIKSWLIKYFFSETSCRFIQNNLDMIIFLETKLFLMRLLFFNSKNTDVNVDEKYKICFLWFILTGWYIGSGYKLTL